MAFLSGYMSWSGSSITANSNTYTLTIPAADYIPPRPKKAAKPSLLDWLAEEVDQMCAVAREALVSA